ncbi:ITGA7 [Cordylochernes scorpioides]|uniref:ITGA7 n=1 Tax=Cordylochernes scorpioides TaxID=51811 RepID=A0ABY6L607_9ARAC|nr:ITGA7 [Cordylochernes scorpioides]
MDDILKDDQWLGVTLKSQGPGGPVMYLTWTERVQTCAHRYVHKGPDFQWGQGICYSLSQYLDLRRAWEPCHNRPVTKAHEQFGYCQAGTSGDISEDANIVIGAPGPYTWRGTVFTNSIHFRMRDDKTWNLGPLLDDVAPVDKYSYLGMSVTSGRFFKGEMNFVGGAPRANGTGQVVFFRKQLSDSTFEVVHVLNGEQFASSFGYTLTSLDLNNDSLVDLVVGAPFYYAKGEGGAVYIYLNSPEGLVLPPIKLTGKVESRFGFSMSTLGDINKDGYTDLAIGAPYEGSGAVYVYLGSPEGIITEPSQVLRVEDLPKFTRSYVTTFGYSLSGGLDLDNNTYPDLLVGAFQNDTVLLIRSRPIIDITTSVEGDLTNIDPTQPGCAMDPNSTLVCFSFEACFTLASGVVNGPVRLRYHIEAEPGRKVSRVKFAGSLHTDTPHVLDREVTLRHRSRHCSRELAYLKEKSDIQHPVAMMLSYSLLQKEPRMPLDGEPLPDLGRFPILNRREALRRFEAKFLKDCGSDEICESNLHLRAELDLPRYTLPY